MEAKVFTEKPHDFSSIVDVTACYINHEDKYLFLKTGPTKPHKGLWGVPGGKTEQNETILECVIREIFEETAIKLQESKIIKLGHLNVRTFVDFVFHMFSYNLQHLPKITLSKDEHSDFTWVSIEEAFKLPLIAGGDLILKQFASNSYAIS